jgi:hypothetical protein
MKYLSFILLLTIVYSCGGHEPSVPMPQINGTWRLTSIDTEVEKTPLAKSNIQLWTFDDDEAELTVTNKSPEIMPILRPEGSYGYWIQEDYRLNFEDFDNADGYGYIFTKGDTLYISNAYIDGATYVFIRQ